MSAPSIYGEVLVQDGNFRHGIGGQSTEDIEKIVNVQVRTNTKRLLVETQADAGQATASIYWNQVTVTSTGLTIQFSSALKWIHFINDDNVDDVFMRLGSIIPTTNTTLAWTLKAGELYDFNSERIPSNTVTVALVTNPSKVAIVRIGAGLA